MKKLRLWIAPWFIAVLGMVLGAVALPGADLEEPAEPDVAPPSRHEKNRGITPFIVNKNEVVSLGKNVTIKAHETTREVVVIGGRAQIDGEVRGDVVVVSGKARVNGTVKGSVVSVLGGVELGPDANVRNDVVSIGGGIIAPESARIGGQRVDVPFNFMGMPFFTGAHWLNDWLGNGLFLARPLPPRMGWAWGAMLLALLFYLLIAVIFAKPLRQCVNALETQPFGSMVAGLLAFLLIGPVVLILIVSVVGILALPFLVCGLIAAFIFGKIAVYRYTGEQLGRQLKVAALANPLGALIVGMLVFCLVYTVPILGFLTWGLAALLGFGAVMITLFGGAGREKTAAAGVPPAVAPLPMMPVTPAASVPGTPPVMSFQSQDSSTKPAPVAAVPLADAFANLPPIQTAEPKDLGEKPAMPSLPPLGEPIATPPVPLQSAPTSPMAPPPLSKTASAFGAPPLLGMAADEKAPEADFSTLPPASFTNRLWAASIDVLFVLVFSGFFLLPGFLQGPRAMLFLLLAYFAGMWSWRGTTLGGIVMGLKVVRLDGRPLKPEVAIIRALAGVLSTLPLLLGFVWAAWDKDRQTWHDKIAGTMVVRVSSKMSLI